MIKGTYINSSVDFSSSRNFHLYKLKGELYKTFSRNTYRILSYYHQGLNDIPRYHTTINKGSEIFAGIKEFQLFGNTLAFTRLEYRYRHKKDIFAHIIFSWLISAKSSNEEYFAENIWGAGLGLTLLSPLGPLVFIQSWGPDNIYNYNQIQTNYHFSAGYKF